MSLEDLIHLISPPIIHILELVGIFIIFFGCLKVLYIFIKSGFDFHDKAITITLGEVLALSLQFKLGAEIIKTVVIRDMHELIILTVVVALRIILSIVVHWEVKNANVAGRDEIISGSDNF
ncbi:DUF1622 domain-containing protein [Aerococcaceae bacterium WGS1372]